jgi:hypothetical protein
LCVAERDRVRGVQLQRNRPGVRNDHLAVAQHDPTIANALERELALK